MIGEISQIGFHNDTYFKLDRVIQAHEARVPNKNNNLFRTKIYLSDSRTIIIRKFTDLLMLMSEFGGFVKLVIIIG